MHRAAIALAALLCALPIDAARAAGPSAKKATIVSPWIAAPVRAAFGYDVLGSRSWTAGVDFLSLLASSP